MRTNRSAASSIGSYLGLLDGCFKKSSRRKSRAALLTGSDEAIGCRSPQFDAGIEVHPVLDRRNDIHLLKPLLPSTPYFEWNPCIMINLKLIRKTI